MKTKRIPKKLMPNEEKENYIKIIRKLPWLYKPILITIKKFLKEGDSLMDVCCADGYLLYLINKTFSGLNLHGLDIDKYFIKKAKEKYPFDFKVQDVNKIRGKYDIITCNLSLHHLDKPAKTIKDLYSHANKVVIISDQIRPSTEKELEKRLKKRKQIIGDKDVSFYEKNERDSILEAYSKEEVKKLFSSLKMPFSIKFFDKDYYERFVAIIKIKRI